MRKIILYTAVSLDGYIAGLNGEIDWLFSDQDYGYYDFLKRIDTTFMGRKTYDKILEIGDFPYKDKTNYVFTRQSSLLFADHVQFISEDIPDFVRELKQEEGKDIWLVGGGEINTLLLNEGLIDELVLSYHPVVLGKGIPLFAEGAHQSAFETKHCKTFESGLVQMQLVKK